MPFDIREPAFLRDPAPHLAKARAAGPVTETRLPVLGPLKLTTTYETARRLMKDQEHFGREPGRAGLPDKARYRWWMPRFMRPLMENMVVRDDPDHKRLRGLIDQAFARTSIDALRPAITTIADDLLDHLDPSQPVEIVEDFTRKLPLLVICDLLGLDRADRPRLTGWLGPLSGKTNLATLLRALPGLNRSLKFFEAEFARAAQSPREGLISALVDVEADGDRLTHDELLAMVFTLFVAGHETTVHLLTHGLVTLLAQPGDARAAMTDPEAAPLVVEEMMRHVSPVMIGKPYYVLRDNDVLGTPLRRGEQVAPFLIAGNYDPERFETPEVFIPDRRPNAHLGFGTGIHVCIGMQLARMEAQVAFSRLFDRFPDLALADPTPERHRSKRVGLRGFDKLYLQLAP